MKTTHPVKQLLLILLGSILTAIAVSVFLLPNRIVSGGVSGVATMLYHTLSIPASISYIVINLILLLLGLKTLGKDFVLRTLIGTGLLSLFLQIFSYIPPLTDNIILAALFGGILYGCGLGVVFISGASTGGTDILGRLLQHKYPSVPIGKLLMIVDGLIIVAALLIFREVDLALFGILTLFMSTFTIDWLIRRMNISHLAFVISEHGDAISKRLISTSPRGVTIIDVKGAYTMESKALLLCALKSSEAPEFQQKILEIDPSAFVIFSQSQYIVGNGFPFYQ